VKGCYWDLKSVRLTSKDYLKVTNWAPKKAGCWAPRWAKTTAGCSAPMRVDYSVVSWVRVMEHHLGPLTMMGLMKDYSRDLKKVVNLELQIYLVMMKAALIWKVTRTVDLTT
jgi:hypothetical protein